MHLFRSHGRSWTPPAKFCSTFYKFSCKNSFHRRYDCWTRLNLLVDHENGEKRRPGDTIDRERIRHAIWNVIDDDFSESQTQSSAWKVNACRFRRCARDLLSEIDKTNEHEIYIRVSSKVYNSLYISYILKAITILCEPKPGLES
jgi:hypothetical protein